MTSIERLEERCLLSTATFLPAGHDDAGELDRDLRRQGYDVIGSSASLPSYATVTPSGQSSYTWASSTTDPRLQAAGGSSRIAACWYS